MPPDAGAPYTPGVAPFAAQSAGVVDVWRRAAVDGPDAGAPGEHRPREAERQELPDVPVERVVQ